MTKKFFNYVLSRCFCLTERKVFKLFNEIIILKRFVIVFAMLGLQLQNSQPVKTSCDHKTIVSRSVSVE